MRRSHDSPVPFDKSAYSYVGAGLQKHWAALHKGDREPYPSEATITRLAKAHPSIGREVMSHGGAARTAAALQDAWRAFHAGDFAHAVTIGAGLGALGSVVANKAAAIHTLYLEKDERRRMKLLREAIETGESAIEQLPDCANAHYTLALVLGRLSQRISILEALASGYAGRVRTSLERTIELEPSHAEAHIALGLYHAEIVSKLGSLAAQFTYGASREDAVAHFRRAIKLAPKSAIAHVEYARGLLLLDADAHRKEVEKLCTQAAACKPLDAMEHLDIERAKHHCTSLYETDAAPSSTT